MRDQLLTPDTCRHPGVLTAATKHDADRPGLNELGTAAVGKEGDLMAIQGDPLADVRAVKAIHGVIFKGKLVPAWVGAH